MDDPEEAKKSGDDEAAAGAGDGSKSNKAGNKSDVMVEVGNKPVPKAKGKCKSVRAANGRKDGAKRMKVATGKPAAEVEVKAKPAAKAATVKTPAKNKTPLKSPTKKK